MDTKDLKTLKAELENIVPKDILEKSKAVGDNLSASVESHKNLHAKIVVITDKITQAKKELEIDIEELSQKKAMLIDESEKIIADRNAKTKVLDIKYRETEDKIKSLEATIVELSARVNATQKNLDSLVLDKNQMAQEITDFLAYIQSLRVQEQEIKNSISAFTDKKNIASREYVELQSLIEDSKKTLQMKNNEILIANERLANLNK